MTQWSQIQQWHWRRGVWVRIINKIEDEQILSLSLGSFCYLWCSLIVGIPEESAWLLCLFFVLSTGKAMEDMNLDELDELEDEEEERILLQMR